MSAALGKIPATIITGFLGAGKTTLVRHVLAEARGRRIAIIVNEFGALGIDGELLRSCGIEGCAEDSIVELANGCICCTVAEDFLPTMQALLSRPAPPEHILIETSGLALPKPLLRAFNWPDVRGRITVDGVITVVDGPAVAAGRFADDPEAVARQRAADPSLEHDNPLAEVFEDQLQAADLVLLNKTDRMDAAAVARVSTSLEAALPRAVKILPVTEGRVDPRILLGLDAAAEGDLDRRPSHHDAQDGAHEHDDFTSFVVALPECDSAEEVLVRLRAAAAEHDVLRMKGFLALRGKPMRCLVQGVGGHFRHYFDRAFRADEAREGRIVVIGRAGIDAAGVDAMIKEGQGLCPWTPAKASL
ncbi:MAG TPA: cobalamin biosynthesis protein CobW, partial [Acetobacteraceae bacterium]|nr:cobalamin biosynthesis protein CobW [Acetobacteraceae bacterium]